MRLLTFTILLVGCSATLFDRVDGPTPHECKATRKEIFLHGDWVAGLSTGHRLDLRWCDLHGSNFDEADLRGAKLRGANLSWSSLRNADLRNADMRGTRLEGTDLRGARIWGTDFRGAELAGARFDPGALKSSKEGQDMGDDP